jgi:hypothetical protein
MADISSAIVYAHAVGVERFSKLVTKHAHHFAPQFFRGDAQIAAWATRFDLRRATLASKPIPPSISGSAARTGHPLTQASASIPAPAAAPRRSARVSFLRPLYRGL